ncbi:TRAFAC clade GTPase domain-containing protein [Brevibacterium paucivorans]|uniref:Double-GTPase 2 domain-containing protein n=1 Tax=Brevibacterium paucivorans TaxID=170994 RepID=A0A2N6VMH0_9MICO|nr:hypothetical protein CJ199_09445 [Brevibacterium paucivorans]
MAKCAVCLFDVPYDTYTWALENTGSAPVVDNNASYFLGREVRIEATLDLDADVVDNMYVEPNADAALNEIVASGGLPQSARLGAELCPICHNPLAPGWRFANVTVIAMCGARASGKSLYIATAIKELKRELLNNGTSLQMYTDTTDENYQTYYERPLFEQMGLMGATVRADTGQAYQLDPLVFSVGGNHQNGRQLLVLRDVAGEELENPPENDGHLDFMKRADVILFMFDPLSVDAISRRLNDLVPTQARSSGSPVQVLDNLQRRIGATQPTPRVGIALSKFDVMQTLADIDDQDWSRVMANRGSAMMRERLTSDDAETDQLLLHQEVKSLLLRMGADEIVNKIENPHTGQQIPHRFFAISALGYAPVGEQVSSLGIAPFRVLDPLQWAMGAR